MTYTPIWPFFLKSPLPHPPWHLSRQGVDQSVWDKVEASIQQPHNEHPLCLVRWWPSLHHVIIIKTTDFTGKRDDAVTSLGSPEMMHVHPVLTLKKKKTQSKSLRLCCERKSFLHIQRVRLTQGHRVLSGTSDMPCRMTAGIMIISPSQSDNSDPEMMMCVVSQGGIGQSWQLLMVQTAYEPGIHGSRHT